MDSRHTNDPAVARHTALANLGYPGFSHRRTGEASAPPQYLLTIILSSDDVDARTLEALPWLLVRFARLNWEPVIETAVAQGWQNRLGFVFSVAVELAKRMGCDDGLKAALRAGLAQLEACRTDGEDDFCYGSMTEAQRAWLREHRPAAARHWHVLTNLEASHVHTD